MTTDTDTTTAAVPEPGHPLAHIRAPRSMRDTGRNVTNIERLAVVHRFGQGLESLGEHDKLLWAAALVFLVLRRETSQDRAYEYAMSLTAEQTAAFFPDEPDDAGDLDAEGNPPSTPSE